MSDNDGQFGAGVMTNPGESNDSAAERLRAATLHDPALLAERRRAAAIDDPATPEVDERLTPEQQARLAELKAKEKRSPVEDEEMALLEHPATANLSPGDQIRRKQLQDRPEGERSAAEKAELTDLDDRAARDEQMAAEAEPSPEVAAANLTMALGELVAIVEHIVAVVPAAAGARHRVMAMRRAYDAAMRTAPAAAPYPGPPPMPR